jgi:uncharacterized protein (DUF1697 family)
MKYVALLRGINVGGKNKVDMKRLVVAMERQEFDDVCTYINSGNIIFSSNDTEKEIVSSLHEIIKVEFGLEIKVLIRDSENIAKLADSIPKSWKNDSEMKCDVMFLWEKYDNESVLDEVTIKPEIDEVRYSNNALVWKVDKKVVTKSGMMKLPGTDVYANMTVRNVNTVRKLNELLH